MTDRPLHAIGYRVLAEEHTLSFVPFESPPPLRTAGGHRLGLTVKESYRVKHDSPTNVQVVVSAYRYHVLDRFGGEILAFHWHPVGVSPVVRPHLHLSGRLPGIAVEPARAPIALGDLHIPTGEITLADIVSMLIEEFGVAPRKPDWQAERATVASRSSQTKFD